MSGYDALYKIVVIGNSGVGKTQLLQRYVKRQFRDETKSTIGCEFLTTTQHVKDDGGKDVVIKAQLWDTAGQERFRSITKAYYRGAKGAVIVFDMTVRDSFESVEMWHGEILDSCGNEIVVLLVGNKLDLNCSRQVSHSEAYEKAQRLGLQYIETSAKTSHGVDNSFSQLIGSIHQNEVALRPKKSARKRATPIGIAIDAKKGIIPCC